MKKIKLTPTIIKKITDPEIIEACQKTGAYKFAQVYGNDIAYDENGNVRNEIQLISLSKLEMMTFEKILENYKTAGIGAIECLLTPISEQDKTEKNEIIDKVFFGIGKATIKEVDRIKELENTIADLLAENPEIKKIPPIVGKYFSNFN